MARRWCSRWASMNRIDKARKKMLGAVYQTPLILIYYSLAPLHILLCGKHLQLLQLLRAQACPFSLAGGGQDLWRCRLRGGGA